MVYICMSVTIEDGVRVHAGTIFTNDWLLRATTLDLQRLRSAEPDERTRPALSCGRAPPLGRAVSLGVTW
jgi:hypothetical protein